MALTRWHGKLVKIESDHCVRRLTLFQASVFNPISELQVFWTDEIVDTYETPECLSLF